MPQEPKKGRQQPAERQFVDREEFIAPVHSALKEPPRTKPLVLVYHGGAGIGKSRLRRELVKQMAADPGVLTATLDFHIPTYRQPEAALLFLRNSISEAYQVRFPSFDLAFAVYWQKTHPDAPLGEDLKPLLEPGSVLSQVLDESGKLPLIGLIPKVSALVGSRQQTADREWWSDRGERELKDLPQIEPGAIVDRLPALWAGDVRDCLAGDTTQPENGGQSPGAATSDVPGAPQERALRDSPHFRGHVPQRRAVLFVDSYEMLWETGASEADFFKRDEWVRELVKQLPEALWVICGRQKLRWEEEERDWGDSLSQHQLGALPDRAARGFLESCDIPTGQIQDAIIKGSKGVPHYLDLAVDTIQSSKSQVPVSKFQGDSPEALVEQFTQHLDKPEAETLKVLSAARFWFYGLFEHLITQYQTGYPATAYDDLARFSFIKDGAAPGTRTMHELMREALQEAQSPELRKRVHLSLHELYAGQLEGLDVKGISEKHRTALTEAFYHGGQAMSAKELWAWFDPAAKVFKEAAQHRLLVPLLREAVESLEARLGHAHPSVAESLFKLAWQLDVSGEYDEAESLYRRALAIAEGEPGADDTLAVECLGSLAELLRKRARYEEAEPLCRRVVELRDKSGKPAMALADALDNLAAVLADEGKCAEAEDLYRRAIATSEKEVGPDHRRTGDMLNNLAALLWTQQRFREAEPLARRSLTILEKNLDVNHPDLAFSLKCLAGALCGLGRPGEAEPLLRRALKLCEENLGPDHPSTAVSANNLGWLLSNQHRFAEAEPLIRRALAVHRRKMGLHHPFTITMANGLMHALVCMGNYGEAEPMILGAIATREKELGPDHPATLLAVHWCGDMYRDMGRCAEAERYLRRLVDAITRDRGPEHADTLGCLSSLARLREKQGRYAEAESLLRDVLAREERVIGSEHPGVARDANALAGICTRAGRHAEAEDLYRRALAIREKVFRQDHPFVAETLEGLAKVCEQTGRTAEAQELTTRAKRIRDKNAQTQTPA